jgi:RNA polymerase sigma-70 factor, ECF subfamily
MNPEPVKPPNSVDTTSKSLLQRIREGNQVAWRQLVAIYGPIVAYWIKQGKLQSDDAKDVSQEVFVAIMRSIDRFERSEGASKFRSWLKVITKSKINDHYRRLQRNNSIVNNRATVLSQTENTSESEIDPDQDSCLTLTENAVIVQSVVKLIRPEFRENTWQSFWLTVVEGMNATEAAAHLKLTSEAVRKNKSRVMARLQQVLLKETV